MSVKWLRLGRSRITNAFTETELSATFEHIAPVGWCGRFLVVDLQEDELADRCRACQRAMDRSDQR